MIDWVTKEDITWMPPLRSAEHGWLIVEGKSWFITKWHHFDDFGQMIETVDAKNGETGETNQFYSLDEGQSWHTELP